MAKKNSVTVCFAVVGAVLGCNMLTTTFVPPARRSVSPAISAATLAAGTMGAAPAFADAIGDAAKKLATASYPFLQEVDWNSKLSLTNPGKASAAEWTKAIAKAIDMGASMDSSLLQAGVYAHHDAIKSVDKNLVTSVEDYEKVVAALGRMIASVPEAKTMAVYDSFGKLVDPAVPKYLMATVKEADAQAAYKALLEFKDVVKANPITPKVVTAPASPKIDAAAAKLADASYPFVQDIDWSSPLAAKMSGFSGITMDALKAVDSALLMGYSVNGGALKEAANAHVKAIENMDAKGVATKADYQAILAGLGKVFATAQERAVTDVFGSFRGIVDPKVPEFLMSSVKASDAVEAYKGLVEFSKVVKAGL